MFLWKVFWWWIKIGRIHTVSWCWCKYLLSLVMQHLCNDIGKPHISMIMGVLQWSFRLWYLCKYGKVSCKHNSIVSEEEYCGFFHTHVGIYTSSTLSFLVTSNFCWQTLKCYNQYVGHILFIAEYSIIGIYGTWWIYSNKTMSGGEWKCYMNC